jgi:hypothetical protein
MNRDHGFVVVVASDASAPRVRISAARPVVRFAGSPIEAGLFFISRGSIEFQFPKNGEFSREYKNRRSLK